MNPTCGQCHASLEEDALPRKPCPKCGSTVRVYNEEQCETVTASDSFAWERVRQYWEVHRLALWLTVALTIGSPFLGLWLAGWPGVLVGLGFSVLAAVVGLRAATRVREVERGR